MNPNRASRVTGDNRRTTSPTVTSPTLSVTAGTRSSKRHRLCSYTCARPAPIRLPGSGLQHWKVAVPLVLSYLRPVVLPLGALVTQEEVEDVLAESLGDQLAVLHQRDRVGQVLR